MKRHILSLLGTTALLGACSTLPSSGPTGREVLRTSAEDKQLGLSVVEADSFATIPPIQADEKGNLGVGFLDRLAFRHQPVLVMCRVRRIA